jgi:hypothetical protein
MAAVFALHLVLPRSGTELLSGRGKEFRVLVDDPLHGWTLPFFIPLKRIPLSIMDIRRCVLPQTILCPYEKSFFSNGVYGFVDYTDSAGCLSISIVGIWMNHRGNREKCRVAKEIMWPQKGVKSITVIPEDSIGDMVPGSTETGFPRRPAPARLKQGRE